MLESIILAVFILINIGLILLILITGFRSIKRLREWEYASNLDIFIDICKIAIFLFVGISAVLSIYCLYIIFVR